MGFTGKDCGEAAPFFRFQKSLLFDRLSLLLEAGVSAVQVLAGQPSLRPDGVLVGVVPGKVAWTGFTPVWIFPVLEARCGAGTSRRWPGITPLRIFGSAGVLLCSAV